MIKTISINCHDQAELVVRLQQKSYKEEATIIGFHKIPALFETVETLRKSKEEFLGYYLESRLVGAISYSIAMNGVEICRLVVDPDCFKLGIATSLIEHLEKQRANSPVINVSTAAKNYPAIQLYKKLGYLQYEITLLEGHLEIVKLQKIRKG